MKKVIIKHYENNESALDRLFDALEHINSAISCLKEQKYKDVLNKIACDIDNDIHCNNAALIENMAKWESCLGKYYKAVCGSINYLLHPYSLIYSSKYVFALMVNMNSHYKSISDTTINLEAETRDWELEEITREEFKELVAEQALSVVDYRYTRNIEKSQTNCKTNESN